MFDINKKLSNKIGDSPKVPAGQNHQAKPKLLEQVRTELRVNHNSKRTEEAYITHINNNLGRSNNKRENENFN